MKVYVSTTSVWVGRYTYLECSIFRNHIIHCKYIRAWFEVKNIIILWTCNLIIVDLVYVFFFNSKSFNWKLSRTGYRSCQSVSIIEWDRGKHYNIWPSEALDSMLHKFFWKFDQNRNRFRLLRILANCHYLLA